MGPRRLEGYARGDRTRMDRAGGTPAPAVRVGNKTIADLSVLRRDQISDPGAIFSNFLQIFA